MSVRRESREGIGDEASAPEHFAHILRLPVSPSQT